MPSADVDRALALPSDDIAAALLGLPEDQWYERKSARIRPPALADALIGFGNADGGTLVVGLHDGKLEGIADLGRRLNDLQQAAIDHTTPTVAATSRLLPCGHDHVLLFEVRPSVSVVHANARDEVFLRVGDENRRLTFAQRQELTFDRGHDAYEARPSRATLSDLDQGLVQHYVEATGATDATRLLRNRGLAEDATLTVAGCLLFAAHPQTWLPEAFVRVLRYRGIERGSGARQQMLSDDRFEGPIPDVLKAARMRIAELVPTRRALGREGRFAPLALIPEDAWLEGVVNAVVHRSYSLGGDHIRVEVFDDRIEVESPGRFPGIVDLTDPLEAPRFARNPRIARVCSDLHFGQELGEGIRRIYEEMRLSGLQEPVYRQSAASVRLLLSGEPVQRALDEQLAPDARAVSVALREARRLSTGEVAVALGRSRPYALRVLESLRAAGVVRWVGKSQKDPRAYWELDAP
jgi:ATP-dependent DNA helicase RecG